MTKDNMKYQLVFCICFISFVSCKKSFPDNVAIGNTEGMKVTPMNVVIGSDSDLSSDNGFVDLDDNDDVDFEINMALTNYGGVEFTHTRIFSLNENTFVLGYDNYDTVFWSKDTFFVNTIPVEEYWMTRHRCYRESMLDSVEFDTIRPYVSQLEPGNFITVDDDWRSEAVHLKRPFYEDYYVVGPWNADTTIMGGDEYDMTCTNFPMNTPCYIGVKIRDDKGRDRLGWIKIQLTENTITILESAIQK